MVSLARPSSIRGPGKGRLKRIPPEDDPSEMEDKKTPAGVAPAGVRGNSVPPGGEPHRSLLVTLALCVVSAFLGAVFGALVKYKGTQLGYGAVEYSADCDTKYFLSRSWTFNQKRLSVYALRIWNQGWETLSNVRVTLDNLGTVKAVVPSTFVAMRAEDGTAITATALGPRTAGSTGMRIIVEELGSYESVTFYVVAENPIGGRAPRIDVRSKEKPGHKVSVLAGLAPEKILSVYFGDSYTKGSCEHFTSRSL